MSTLLDSVGRMFEGFSLGTPLGKGLIAVGSLFAAFYSPIVALLVTCFTFTTVDMIYGLRVAKKQKQKITSDKNWKGTLSKLLDEFAILSLARMLEFSVLGTEGVFVLTGGATVILSLTELWSILENLNTLNPKGPWKSLGKFLKKKGEDYIGTELDLDYDKRSNDSEMDSNAS